LFDVWQRPGGEVMVVGSNGLILHNEGDVISPWQVQSSATSFTLNGITGTENGVAYAVGQNGIVLRNSGEAWELLVTGERDQLEAVAVDACGGLHCAGYWGIVLSYDN
jgi:hypothetical protein